MQHWHRTILPLLLAAAFLLSACGPKKPQDIKDFQELLTELDGRNADIMKKKQEIQDILQAYNQSVPEDRKVKFTPSDGNPLTADQEKLLKDLLQQEKDVSYQGLLRQVIEKNDEIRGLQEKIADLEARLPKPYDVKRGDTHYRLCLKYLTEVEGLSRPRADSLIDRVAMVADLVKGFQVWFYYKDGIFGTFVTQGTARISPSRLARVNRRKVIDEARAQGRTQAFEEILDSIRRETMPDTIGQPAAADSTKR